MVTVSRNSLTNNDEGGLLANERLGLLSVGQSEGFEHSDQTSHVTINVECLGPCVVQHM